MWNWYDAAAHPETPWRLAGGQPLQSVAGVIDESSMEHVSQHQYIHHWATHFAASRITYSHRVIRLIQSNWRWKSLTSPPSDDFDEVIRFVGQHNYVVLNTQADRIPLPLAASANGLASVGGTINKTETVS